MKGAFKGFILFCGCFSRPNNDDNISAMDITPDPNKNEQQENKAANADLTSIAGPQAPKISMAQVELDVAPGVVARFTHPADWKLINLPGTNLQFGAWRSPDNKTTLIPSTGVFNSQEEHDLQISRTIRSLIGHGCEIPVVMCLPVVMQDGTRALQINFPVHYPDGKQGFEYAHVLYHGNRWVRLAAITIDEELDTPELIALNHPITSSLRISAEAKPKQS